MKVISIILMLLGVQLALGQQESTSSTPLDDITWFDLTTEKRVLPYPEVSPNDILWKERVWREIDTRQLMNLPFRYEAKPFFSILIEEIQKGNITAYSTENDQFKNPLNIQQVKDKIITYDSIPVYDPYTYEYTINVVENKMDPQDVVRYRLKEVWWFDSEYSTLRVRILGIAPIVPKHTDNGDFLAYLPLFWVYFPDCREALAKHPVHNAGNDANPMTWNDWLEMRFFDSYITKVSNVHDRRLQDYLAGEELLLESEKLEQELFNKEMDMWQR